MEKKLRKKREAMMYPDFVSMHTSPGNVYGVSVGERDFSGLMEKSASLLFSMPERNLTRRIAQLMHKPKSLLEEIQYRQCLIKAFSNMCKQITENAVFGGYELDLLEAENCINGEDRAHVEATGVGPIKQFRRLLSLMLLRDFRTLLEFLKCLLCNNTHVVEGVLAEVDKYVQQQYQKPVQCTLCQLMSRVDLSLVLDELLSDDEDWLPFYIKVSQNVSVGPNSKFWRELVNRVILYDLHAHVYVANVITKALSNCGFHSDIVKMLSKDKQFKRSSFICRCNETDVKRSDFTTPLRMTNQNEESKRSFEERNSASITHDGCHVNRSDDTHKTGFLMNRGAVFDNWTLLRMNENRGENKGKKLFASKPKEHGILKEISTGSYGNNEERKMGFSSNNKEYYEDRGNKTAQLKVKASPHECCQSYLWKTSMQEQNERRKPENSVCPDEKSTPNDGKPQSYETLEQEGSVPRDNRHLDENEIIPTLMRELEKRTDTQKKNCWSENSPNGAGKTDSCENNTTGLTFLKEYVPDEDLLKMAKHKPDKLTETSTTSEFPEVPNGNQSDEVSSENFGNKMTLLKDDTPERLTGDEGIYLSFETQSYSSIDQQTLLSISKDTQKAEESKSSVLENEKEASGLDQQMVLLKNDLREYDDGTDSGVPWCQCLQNSVDDSNSITDDKGTGLTPTIDNSHASSSSGSEVRRIIGYAANSIPVLETITDDDRHSGDRHIVVFDFLILVIFAISLFNYVVYICYKFI